MSKIAIGILFFFFTIGAFAQGPVNIGLKFGSNTSRMVTNIESVVNQNLSEEALNSYLAGAFVRVNLGRLYFQPEAYFNTKGGIITPVGNDQFQIPTSTTFNYQTIDVPALIGIKLIHHNFINLRVYGGPVYSYVTANSFITELSDLNANDLNDRYMGWQFGTGMDIWFLTFDLRVERGNNIITSESTYQARSTSYLLSAGIKLF